MSSPQTDSESERESTPPPPKRPRQSRSPRIASSASDVKSTSLLPTTDNLTATSLIMDNAASNLPPLSVSMLGVEPLDEFIREIADFVHHMVMTRPNMGPDAKVEVEAKLGILKDRVGGNRISLPVLVETILAPDSMDLRFESNMSAMQHKHFNTLLNDLQRRSSEPLYPASLLEYKHFKLVDSFYMADNRDREKVRVTRDEKTGTVIEITRKMRLGDLNIYCPKRSADWRVSVSLEVPVPHPVGTPSLTRRKDRICYSHEEFNVDLTQVVSNAGPTAPPETLHELEVEIARPALLVSTALKRGDPSVPEHERNAFDELIRSFVNNARILVKNASEGWH